MTDIAIDGNSITTLLYISDAPSEPQRHNSSRTSHSTPCFQRRGQRKHAPQQATLLSDCHYSLSQLTVNSSSSDSDDSSEESPQSHDSSESASQEVILRRVLLSSLTTVGVYGPARCPGRRKDSAGTERLLQAELCGSWQD